MEYILEDGEGVSQNFFLNAVFDLVFLALYHPELSTVGILTDSSGVCPTDGELNLWKCSKSEENFETRYS